MQALKIIKRRELLNTAPLSIDEDRGITEFRSFEPIAGLYVSRICSMPALDVMMEIIETIGRQLTERRDMLTASQSDFEN